MFSEGTSMESKGKNERPDEWLKPDENAKTMLRRLLIKRDSYSSLTRHLPAFQRIALPTRSVVEIAGPAGSAKSELVIQAIVNCILPQEWKGVAYGGCEAIAIYFDLDCRFDMKRFSHCLKSRIHSSLEYHRPKSYSNSNSSANGKEDISVLSQPMSHQDDDLFKSCTERFFYMRCYNSFQFLAAMKTIRPLLQKANRKHANGARLFIIDSISAFYWLDRACNSNELEGNRKGFSYQVIWESIVQELRYLLKIYPSLILATKPTRNVLSSKEDQSSRERRKLSSKLFHENSDDSVNNLQTTYREFMPAVWQAFVTHRLLLAKSEEMNSKGNNTVPMFTARWEAPCLQFVDKFIVKEDGISLVM